MKMARNKKIVEQVGQPEVKENDPVNQPMGLRGLKKMVFEKFTEEYQKNKDLNDLPNQDEMTNIVKEKFPQSMWVAKPKIHYSYYKSKFISGLGYTKKLVLVQEKDKIVTA